MTAQSTIFQPIALNNGLVLKNRIVMAPLTRCMADDDLVPTPAMADYYQRRADAGLIITEAILVSQQGQGYPNTPGIYNEDQTQAWKKVTQSVQQDGGKIFAQLWHTGRVSHSSYHDGALPLAPSAIAISEGHVARTNYRYETPTPMTINDINSVKKAFVLAAHNAVNAGFDGIEIHAANGYLIDQFLHWSSNQRSDLYGGTPQNMARFLLEILDEITHSNPSLRVGLRLSPHAYVVMDHDDRDKQVFDYLLPQLARYKLAYIHTGMLEDSPVAQLGSTVTQYIKKHFKGPVIACGGYTPQTAEHSILQGNSDLVAIGRPFIANPNYIEKIQTGQALTPYDPSMLEHLE